MDANKAKQLVREYVKSQEISTEHIDACIEENAKAGLTTLDVHLEKISSHCRTEVANNLMNYYHKLGFYVCRKTPTDSRDNYDFIEISWKDDFDKMKESSCYACGMG